MTTGKNSQFLKSWYELEAKKINFDKSEFEKINFREKKWIPYNKGGNSRKWYGNNEFVVDWSKSKDFNRAKTTMTHFYLKDGLTWSFLTMSIFNARYFDKGFLWDVAGSPIFVNNKIIEKYILGFINSCVASYLLNLMNPTLNFQAIEIEKLPIKIDENNFDSINKLTELNISISKEDWDRSELSWNFAISPILNLDFLKTVQLSFEHYIDIATKQYSQLHQNEEEINRKFIEIYGLSDELTPDISLEYITILQKELDITKLLKAIKNKGRIAKEGLEKFVKKDVVIQQLLSYAVGCFMGIYRLNKPGLHIAHPNPTEEEIKAYKIQSPLHKGKKEVKFEIDEDGIIPMLGSYGRFSDDIVIRIKHFIEIVWGEETLTENINFIQQCLDQDLEDYLVGDFWDYHCKVYQKKPIYWLFSSETGYFQVLVYMHRINKFTVQK